MKEFSTMSVVDFLTKIVRAGERRQAPPRYRVEIENVQENLGPAPEVALLLANIKAASPSWRSCAVTAVREPTRMFPIGSCTCRTKVYGAQYHTTEIVTPPPRHGARAGQVRRLYRGNHRRRHREEMGAIT